MESLKGVKKLERSYFLFEDSDYVRLGEELARTTSAPAILDLLKQLDCLKMSKDILIRTKVGRSVNDVAKRSDLDPDVRAVARKIKMRWQNIVLGRS